MNPEPLTVVKIGGAVIEDPSSLSRFLLSFARIAGNKILVHGGGRTATALASRLGLETRMSGGRRITDAPMLDVVTMVYGGLLNKRIVASLAALSLRPVGLTGADCGIILSHKRPVGEVDYGLVGDIDRVDSSTLRSLLRMGLTPVLAPLTHDGKGTLLNTNADTIAAHVAQALAPLYPTTLVYCFEKPGVLARPDDPSSVIPRLTPESYEELRRRGVIQGGMLPKIDNAFLSLRAGVLGVVITCFDTLSDPSSGTTLTLR